MANVDAGRIENIKPLVDILLNHMLNNRQFRREFLKDPVACSKKHGYRMGSQVFEILKDYDYYEINDKVTFFNDKLVLCSSAPA